MKGTRAKESPPARSLLELDQWRLSSTVLLIVLLAFLAYSNALSGDFVFDDTEQIVNNPSLRSWDYLPRAFTAPLWAFEQDHHLPNALPPLPYYRPLLLVLFTLNFHLFGLWPQGWHLVSLFFHILCAVGVYLVIGELSARKVVAVTAALIFTVHPIHTESVSWMSGITDPLYSVFCLAAFYCYLRLRRLGTVATSEKRKWWIGSLTCFLLALFSKETAISLIPLIAGYELVQASGSLVSRLLFSIRKAAPFLVAALFYLIPRYLALGDLMWHNPQAPDRPLAHTLLTLPWVLVSYLLHLLWPVDLSITYATSFVTQASSLRFVIPTLGLLLAGVLVVVFRRKLSSDVWIGLLLMAMPLLPVLNLGEISRDEYLINDRYLYLSVAGWGYWIGLAIAAWMQQGNATGRVRPTDWSRQPKLAGAAVGILILLFALLTMRENRAWADSYSLWSNAARVRPHYWATHYNQGLALLAQNRFAEARSALERANGLKADKPEIYDGLGRAQAGMGDFNLAIASFTRALTLKPQMIESLNNLGTVYFQKKDHTAAERYFKEAQRAAPQVALTHFNLAQCYTQQRRYEEAVSEFTIYLESNATDAQAQYELALVYEQLGKLEPALSHLQRGLALARVPELQERIAASIQRLRQIPNQTQ